MNLSVLNGEFANSFYLPIWYPFDIIWSENENLIDRFIPEIFEPTWSKFHQVHYIFITKWLFTIGGRWFTLV